MEEYKNRVIYASASFVQTPLFAQSNNAFISA